LGGLIVAAKGPFFFVAMHKSAIGAKARQQSAFSQNYKWLNPATKEIEPQETYCERLDDIIVCGSVYNF